jgi:uncharacterized protein (TIGR02271 family)
MQPRDQSERLDDDTNESRTLELREEELHVQREMREVGQAELRTRIEEVPARLEVEAFDEEVEVEHVPIGQVVSERRQPYQDGETLIVPIYEEQLVVTKRLLLREELHVRRTRTMRRELFEDTLRRERLEVDDPEHTGMVHERFSRGDAHGETVAETPQASQAEPEHEGFLSNLVHRALQ